ncbi:MAG: immunoglobulin domain-containing protein [Flavobacterium sp.]
MKKLLPLLQRHFNTLVVLILFTTAGAYAQTPVITDISPNTSVTYRSLITITGSGFTGAVIRFNATTTNYIPLSVTDTQIIVATPAFAVPAGASSTTITVRVRVNNTNYTAGNLTYFAPSATVVNNAKVGRLYTDWQGYWTSNNTTTTLANQPDRQHSLIGLEYGGITYSTGVADATLTSKGISYTPADFKALPVNSISGTTPSSSSASNFFAFASKMDGSATSGLATAPEIAGRKAKDVLIDGVKGLGIGSGLTNMSTSSIFEFVVSDIAESRINDGEPDLVVSQVAEPTTGDNDIYCFVDLNGNIVGNPVSVTMQNIPPIGTYKLDLFNITFNTTYDVATVSTTSTSNTTRPIRLVGYKLSDFGITADNMNDIAGFKIMPSGISDPAFIAYNANSMLIPSPKIVTQPSSVVACTGTGTGTSFTINATGTNLVYQWKKNGISLTDTGNITGAATAVLNISNVSASDVAFYTCEVTNAAGSVLSNPAYLNTIIAVQPIDNTACLNVTGPYVEVIANGLSLTYQWYSNTTNNTTTGTLIPGATNYYYVPPVTATGTRYYYAVINNNGLGCVRETSTAAKFTVGATAVSGTSYIGGTAGSNNGITTASVCSGNTAVLRNTGGTGTGYQWEESVDGISGWNTVSGGSGGTTNAYTTAALTATTYYRMRVKTTSCEVYSNILTVTVGAEAGIIEASSKVICTGTSTTVSVTGATTSIQWQQSANGTTGWANVTGGSGATTETYTTPVLTSVIYYRTIVTGAACSNPNSDPIQVIVNPAPSAGTVSSNKTICTGTSTTVKLTGATGTTQWQRSTDNNTFTDIAGATNDTYTTGILTQTTYYRAIVTAVGCPATTTSAVTTVTVSTAAAVGTVSSSQTICNGATAALSVTGAVGGIRWQQSADGSTGWVNVTGGTGGTAANYTTAALTATTYYRVRTINGACSATSNTVIVTVAAAIATGTVSSNQSVCNNSATTVSISGTTGALQWQQSADGLSNWANASGGSGAATASYTTPALTATTHYRVMITSGSCSVYSGTVTVTTTPVTTGIASGSTTICPQTTASLSLIGQTGTIQWQQSANGTTGWANVTGGTGDTTANYTTAALAATTHYRARITNNGCTQDSNVVVVTINNTFIWNGDTSSDWHTASNWSCNAIPTLSDNCIIPLRPNQPIVSQNTMAYGKTLDVQAGAVVTINTERNITIQDGITVAPTGNIIVNNKANLVQITDSNNNNSGNIVVKRNSSKLYRQDYTLWSTPVIGQKLFQFSPLTLPERFYVYRDSAMLYMKVPNLSAASTTTFTTGRGYLIRMPNGNAAPGYNAGTTSITLNQQFTGVPNNGTIMVPVVHEYTAQSSGNISSYGYNSVGNPYPSTINIYNFIDTNDDALETGTLYFWRKKNNNNNTSYTAINKTGYVENGAEGGNVGTGFVEGDEPNWVINPGQGFVVQVIPGATHIKFNNAMRRAVNNNQFFRNGSQPAEMSRIWLTIASAQGTYAQALVGYSAATTDGIDFGYDTPLFSDGVAALYTKGAGKDLSIQAKGAFAATDVVPLHYRASQAGQYTMSLTRKDGLFEDGQNVYLRDNQEGIIHDFAAGAYTFTAAEGVTENRFDVIYTTDGALGTNNPGRVENGVVIYKNANGLTIETPGTTIKDICIFDISGRLLHKEQNAGNQLAVELAAEEQMLIVQVTADNGIKTSTKVIY